MPHSVCARAVHRDDGASPKDEVVGVVELAGLLVACGAGIEVAALTVAGIGVVLAADITAELHADVGAWNVVEPCAVKAADLHVFDRSGLNRKISGLSSRHRHETCCRAAEKT